MLGQTPSTASDKAQGQPIPEDVEKEEFDGDPDLFEPFTRPSISSPSRKFNKGPGSADYFLHNVNELSEIPDDDDNLDVHPDIYDPAALPSRRLLIRNQVRLPPLDVARRWFAAQYTYLGTIFAFTDPASFEVELVAARRRQPDLSDREACLASAKVLATLALGKLYSVNQFIDNQGPPGFEYFTQALQLLPDCHEEGSILCVETLALVGYFMQNMNRHDAAFLYIGKALRMAICLGLHQEVSPKDPTDPGLDEIAREHRRRVWWSIYSLDRILSVKSGNPITIHDEDIGVRLPSRLPGEAEYCPAVVLRHYTEVSRILGEINKFVYRKSSATKSAKQLMASVQRINSALTKWDRELPKELRFDPDKLTTSRESVSTFSHYYQCINMIARPLLFHVVRRRLQLIRTDPQSKEATDWKEGLSPATIGIIERCIFAAEETIRMMSEARSRELLATYGYMDGEHVFSAAIVLVLACAAFPTGATTTRRMNTGLRLLREMAERGWNSHMGARYQLLSRLRSALLPADANDPLDTPSAFSVAEAGISPAVSAMQSPPVAGLPQDQEAEISPEFVISPQSQLGVGFGEADNMGYFGAADDTAPGNISDEFQYFSLNDDMVLDPEIFASDTVGMVMDSTSWVEGFVNPLADAAGYDFGNMQWTQGI